MEARSSSKPVKILIVDDHPNTATMLARVLARFDKPVEIITANSGEDALEKIDDQVVDILITDFMMPGLNGLELIEKLKGEKKPAHTILITAYDTPGLAITARRLNVQDYLVKPVQPEKVRSIVSRVIDELRPTSQAPQVSSIRQFKILIADDYPDNLRLLSTRLQSEGYNFIPAWDGEETLIKTREEQPDLILLDVNMPKKDGFEVLAEMRADPEISHIPVIIITAARIGPKDIREGLTLGADDYIIKPFDWRELAARIHSKLRVKQAEDVLRRRTKELGVLPEIGRELSARLDVDELSSVVLNRTVETLSSSTARLDIFLPDGSVLSRERNAGDAELTVLEETRDEVLDRCLAAHVLDIRKGVIIDDIASDERWLRCEPETNGTGAAIAVPLLGRQDVIGVLTLTHVQKAYFSEDHLTLVQAIASQAAIAVENAQLFGVEHKRVQELVAINQIAREINRFTYSRQLLENLPRLIQDELGYPAVAVWDGLLASGSNGMKLCSMVGAVRDVDPEVLISVPQKVATSGSTIILSDPNQKPSVVAVPLMLHDKVSGVLSIYHPYANAFQESDRILLETLSMQIGSALEQIGLFESVEHEQRRLLAVLHSAADAIMVMDSHMRLTLANPAGERLFTDPEALIGQPLPMDHGYDEMTSLLDQVRESNSHQQGEVAWPDGRTFSVLVTPVEDGGQVAVLHDVTDFKAIAQLKNEYIATASHDLKNPIQAVLGYNDLLIKAGALNDMQTDFTKRIRSSALQMRDLVLNLLEISRLESGMPMNYEQLNLHEMLNEVAKEFDYRVQAKGHTFDLEFCEGDPCVEGDKTLLQQVARNLLGNAVKYTPEDGQIGLATELDNGNVVVKFRDTGIGIAEEDLQRIFDKFYRVQTDETQDIEGSGLGLAIVRSIVENHDGQVMVESEVGKGSVFSIRLPLYRGS